MDAPCSALLVPTSSHSVDVLYKVTPANVAVIEINNTGTGDIDKTPTANDGVEVLVPSPSLETDRALTDNDGANDNDPIPLLLTEIKVVVGADLDVPEFTKTVDGTNFQTPSFPCLHSQPFTRHNASTGSVRGAGPERLLVSDHKSANLTVKFAILFSIKSTRINQK